MPSSQTKRRAAINDAPSVFAGTGQVSWMENHRPVQPLGSQSALDTAITSDGQPILFSYDDTFSFQATVAADGSAPGWANYSIADEVSGQIAGFQVSQAINQDGSPGAISILAKMLITDNTGSYHQIWLLAGMDNAADAPWFSDSTQRNWTELPYSCDSVPGVSAATLQIADLRVLEVSPQGTAGCGLVHAVGAGGVLQSFTLDMSGSNPSAAWTYVPPETSFTSLNAVAVGAPRAAIQPGIYKLYPNLPPPQSPPPPNTYVRGGPMLLSFLEPGAEVVYFPILSNGTASAIATLPADSYEGRPVTDLFVSDGPNLNLYLGKYDYSGNNPPNNPPPPPWPNPITIANLPWLSGCTELYAATDNKVVSLWGLTGGGSVFHMQAPFEKRHRPSEWSTPVPMMNNVATAAIHISRKRGLTSMFLVQNQPAAAAGATRRGQKATGPNPANLNAYSPFGSNGRSLYELHKDHLVKSVRPGGTGMVRGNSHWRKRPVHLPSDANYMTLQTYTHTIQFADQYGNPASHKTVAITTTATTIIEVNGKILTVTSTRGATCKTDVKGCIELLQDGSSVAAPTLTFALAGGTAPATVTVDPTANVRATMVANVTAVPSADNSITKQSWYQLPAGQKLSDIQSSTNEANSVVIKSTAERRARLAHAQMLQATGDGSVLGDIGSFFGDVWHAICEAAEDIASIVVTVADGIATLAISLGNEVCNFVLDTYEDICAALAAIVNFLGAIVNDIFQWLAFVFNWGNIIAIQQNLLAFNTAMLNSISPLMNSGFAAVASDFEKMASNVSNFNASTFPPATFQSNNQANNNLQQQQQLPPNTPPGNAPQMSWGQSQLPSPSASTGAMPRSRQKGLGDVSSTVIGDIVAFSETVGDDLIDLAENTITLQAAAQNILTSGETAIAGILNDVATAVSSAPAVVDPIISQIATTLTQQIDIPLFTQLYADATDGEPLTWLSLAALIQAVPCTFVYAAVAPNQPAANFLNSAQLNALQATVDAQTATGAIHMRRKTGGGRRVGDGQASLTAAYLRLALGVLHAGRTISAVALAEAPTAVAQKPAIVDCVVWCFEVAADFWISCAESDSIEWVDWVNFSMAIMALLNCWSNDDEEQSLQTACACFSIVAGVCELIGGINDLSQSSNTEAETLAAIALTTYGANEALEFIEQVQIRSGAEKASQYTLGVRGVLMIASGVAEACAGAAELTAATSATKNA